MNHCSETMVFNQNHLETSIISIIAGPFLLQTELESLIIGPRQSQNFQSFLRWVINLVIKIFLLIFIMNVSNTDKLKEWYNKFLYTQPSTFGCR